MQLLERMQAVFRKKGHEAKHESHFFESEKDDNSFDFALETSAAVIGVSNTFSSVSISFFFVGSMSSSPPSCAKNVITLGSPH